MAGCAGWALHNPNWLLFTQSTMRMAPMDWYSLCPCPPLALMTFKNDKCYHVTCPDPLKTFSAFLQQLPPSTDCPPPYPRAQRMKQ